MTFKPCKFDCKKEVEMRETDKGWRAFEEDGKMHNCPKSPYNQQKRLESSTAEQEDDNHADHIAERKLIKPEQDPDEEGTFSEVAIFHSEDPRQIEAEYHAFLKKIKKSKSKVQGAQFQMSADKFGIALYYEVNIQ